MVHEHDARRLHYDLRLEHDGVLKCWAVPKGPSLDPRERRLAVETEDHPLEYGDFEGVIPAGEYGGGPVLLWDRGRWIPEGDVDRGLRDGKLDFRLEGAKLRGRWTLVRLRRKERERDKINWLLIKRRDAEARSGDAAELVETRTESVLTGRDIAQVAAGAEPILQEPVRPSEIAGAREAPLPESAPLQLATPVEVVPAGEGWFHEPKLDGYRLLCRVEGGEVALTTRGGHDWTDRFEAIASAAAALPCRSAILDGEAVVLDRRGISDFGALQRALSGGGGSPALVAFDLLYLDGWDLRGAPLRERKRALAPLIAAAAPVIRYGDHFEGPGDAFFREACELGLEGVVSKRAEGTYEGRRTRGWLKAKCLARETLEIAGFTDPSGTRLGFGALIVGKRDAPGGALRYAGKVGTGFSDATLASLRERLDQLERPTPAIADPPRALRGRHVHWVEPELAAEVAFSDWTTAGVLRHPRFVGLREPAPARRKLALTNPDRIYYPGTGITKRSLAAYYEAIADLALPHLRHRPLTLLRCPDGIDHPCFFQKHIDGAPTAVTSIDAKEGEEPYAMIEDLGGLIAMVQLGVLELHVWGARAGDLERPDIVVFDLDPDEELPWGAVVAAALDLRDRLERLGLEAFVRLTGGKGLHVVVPLVPGPGWRDVKRFAAALARHMAREQPDRFVATASMERRSGKIFIDYLRNSRGATAIASYSVRARAGAPVALPVAWDELDPGASAPPRHGASEVPDLVRRRPDPWADFESARRPIDDLFKR